MNNPSISETVAEELSGQLLDENDALRERAAIATEDHPARIALLEREVRACRATITNTNSAQPSVMPKGVEHTA